MEEIGLRFALGSDLSISTYARADYAVASNDLRSVSGVAVLFSDTAIGWNSSMQKCVTPATCEVEYVALCNAYNQALFTRAILMFLKPELSGMRIDIFGDNVRSKAIVVPRIARRGESMHIDAKLHTIRGLIHTGE